MKPIALFRNLEREKFQRNFDSSVEGQKSETEKRVQQEAKEKPQNAEKLTTDKLISIYCSRLNLEDFDN